MARPLFSARRWHQYAGLVAFLWLAVLGLTGWLMANREEWPWLWEHGLPAEWLPAEVVKTARSGLLRWLQAYPADERRLVGGGYQGAWYSSDGGKTWSASRADHAAPLNINALEAAGQLTRIKKNVDLVHELANVAATLAPVAAARPRTAW